MASPCQNICSYSSRCRDPDAADAAVAALLVSFMSICDADAVVVIFDNVVNVEGVSY